MTQENKTAKNIVVITGSPRAKGNSNRMAAAFIQSAEQKGHRVTRIDATKLAIDGCHACGNCYKTGKPCVFDDDFNKVASTIETADALVFVMPVYWFSIPAKIKALIDKFYAFIIGGHDISGKSCALITCCEDSDATVMDGVKIAFEQCAAYLKWNIVGEVLISEVSNIGDIENTDGLEAARNLSEKF